MNKIIKVNLGRQAFTLAQDAHELLKTYLDEIENTTGKSTAVIEEVELRVAELLTERGIDEQKVVLRSDIEAIKRQLGEASDFKDNDESAATAEDNESPVNAAKKLYRDTDNGMLAGVAAGLAAYFGIDALIVRLIFVILVFSGGAGILVYLLLWVLVPEAKSQADRLKMNGRAVTIDSLKEVVERADVPAAARRAQHKAQPVLLKFVRIIVKIAGIGIIITAIAGLIGSLVSGLIAFIYPVTLGGVKLFPVGNLEWALAAAVMAVAISACLIWLLIGVSALRFGRSVPGWLYLSFIGIFMVSTVAGAVLAYGAVPDIRQRYEATQATETRKIKPFKDFQTEAGFSSIDVAYESSNDYKIIIDYLKGSDASKIKTEVKGDTLTIDTPGYKSDNKCTERCTKFNYSPKVTIFSPKSDFNY
jgi:phage shock protein PspC (stress-responsive transcriptional regulator)